MKRKSLCFVAFLSVILFPVLAQADRLILGGPDSRSATEALTRRVTEEETPGDIYRGTVFGAEKKTYPGTVLGERPVTTKKLMYDTSLVHAVKVEDADRVRTLIYANVDVNEKNYAGLTPLTIAAEKGNLPIIQLLVERGKANVNAKSSYGITPLIAAAAAGKSKAAIYLIGQGADVNVKDDLGKTPLLYASKFNEPQMVSLLAHASQDGVDFADSDGNTPLIYSAQRGYLENVKTLLANGADVNYTNPTTGLNALSAAAAEGQDLVVKLLVKTGKAHVNITDNAGRSPIFYVVEQNQPQTLRTLLSLKADFNQPDSAGVSPLMHAAALNRQECLQFLLKQKRINIHAQDNQGRNALSYSAYAKNDIPTQKLIQAHADIDLPDNDGNTPLMHAIQARNNAAALLLLQEGADPKQTNNKGETPASLAAQFLPNSSTARLLGVK